MCSEIGLLSGVESNIFEILVLETAASVQFLNTVTNIETVVCCNLKSKVILKYLLEKSYKSWVITRLD